MKANHILVDFENVLHLPPDRIGKDSSVFSNQCITAMALSDAGKVTYADGKKSSVES